MDIPTLHRFSDPAAMLARVDAHPLGAWVCPGAHGVLANHVPFLLDRHRGDCGTLVRAVHDRDWLLQMLHGLTGRHEARQPRPWQVADAPADLVQQAIDRSPGSSA